MADHGARAHAEYPPSGAHRWMKCHGSIGASHGIPQTTSIYAEEGNECHEAASEILEGVPFDRACRGLTDEQKLIVEEYTDFCFAVADDMLDDDPKTKIMVEKRMHGPGISPKFYGTGDWGGFSPRTGLLRVIDLKAGAVPVYVRDKLGAINPQLGSYLLLMLAELGAPVSPWHFDPAAIGVKKIKITIVQPRVYSKAQTTTVDIGELEELLEAICHSIDAIEGGDTTRVAGDWCKFCPAKGACPTLRKHAVKKAALDFEPETNIPFAEWAAVLAEAEMIAAHVNGIKEKIRRALEKGMKVEGFKLVAKRQTRKWIDEDDAAMSLAAAGLPDAQIFTRKIISPAAAKKALKIAKRKLDLDGLIELSSGGPTIALASDPREAIDIKPGADFEDEEE